MVGEQFPWRRRRRRRGGAASRFIHARRSHNSVLGIREYARTGGADVQCLDLDLGLDGIGSRGCCCGCCSKLDSDEEGQGPKGANPKKDEDDEGGSQTVGERCCCYCSRSDGENSFGNREDGTANTGTDATDMNRTTHSCCANTHDNDDGEDSDEDSDDLNDGADDRDVIHSLFAFPAECNATGLRPDLGIAALVKQGALSDGISHRCRQRGRSVRINDDSHGTNTNANRLEDGKESRGSFVAGGQRRRRRQQQLRRSKERWWVLLDAAKFVGTGSLDLAKVEADFVAVSFYKIFGQVVC